MDLDFTQLSAPLITLEPIENCCYYCCCCWGISCKTFKSCSSTVQLDFWLFFWIKWTIWQLLAPLTSWVAQRWSSSRIGGICQNIPSRLRFILIFQCNLSLIRRHHSQSFKWATYRLPQTTAFCSSLVFGLKRRFLHTILKSIGSSLWLSEWEFRLPPYIWGCRRWESSRSDRRERISPYLGRHLLAEMLAIWMQNYLWIMMKEQLPKLGMLMILSTSKFILLHLINAFQISLICSNGWLRLWDKIKIRITLIRLEVFRHWNARYAIHSYNINIFYQ